MPMFKAINWKGLYQYTDELEIEAEDVSDEYHTMSELYEHRYALFAALIKVYDII